MKIFNFDFFEVLLAYLFYLSPRIQFWSQKLEILILKRKKILTVPARFELSTPRLQSQNSTTELRLSQEVRAKKLVASWNNSDWQFLKWIAGTLVKSQFWFFNSFCSTIFLLTNNIYIISTGSRLVEIYLHPFLDGAFIITFLHLHWKWRLT